jgi:hypothetical protein
MMGVILQGLTYLVLQQWWVDKGMLKYLQFGANNYLVECELSRLLKGREVGVFEF